MAFASETTPRTAGLAERMLDGAAHWFADASQVMARRRVARSTYNELAALSDRDLADLGMNRTDIRRIALEAARGAR